MGKPLIFNELENVKSDISDNTSQLSQKANVAWGETFEATLLNGWTGNLYYEKNDLGVVHLHARNLVVGTGSGGTNIALLPVGYRPVSYSTFHAYNSLTGAQVAFFIDFNGNIQLRNAITTGNGIRFDSLHKAVEA